MGYIKMDTRPFVRVAERLGSHYSINHAVTCMWFMFIQNFYDKATSAVLFNSSIGDWFRTTVGVQQGCLLSPTPFNGFLERIMTDAFEDDEGTVSI